MDSMYFNKIAGSVLASLLLLVGLRTFIEILYPEGNENLSKGQIVVTQNPVPAPGATGAKAGGAPAASAAAEPAEPPANIVLASSNADQGKAAAKACAACHNWEKGSAAKVGPSLYGVVGRDIGKQAGFKYSVAFQQKGGQWSFDELYSYLKNPKQWIPGNNMAYAGVKNPQDRANIIAFLDGQSDSPLPLPQK